MEPIEQIEKMVEYMLGHGYGSDPDCTDVNYLHERSAAHVYWHYRQAWMIRVESGEMWCELECAEDGDMLRSAVAYAQSIGLQVHFTDYVDTKVILEDGWIWLPRAGISLHVMPDSRGFVRIAAFTGDSPASRDQGPKLGDDAQFEL
jgi:hypothetical protein